MTMGFLSMCGLVTAEEHNRIVAKLAKLEKQIADAEVQMRNEDFGDVSDHAGRVALVMVRLRAARSRIDKVEDAAPLRDRIGELERQFTESALLAAERAKEIARLKPLAEATERRRANDAKRVRPSRAKNTPVSAIDAPRVKKGAGK
jgi:argininosuccinate lyase